MKDVLAALVANADVPPREWIAGALRSIDQSLASVQGGEHEFVRTVYLSNVDFVVRRHLAAYGEIEIPEGLSDEVRALVRRLEQSYRAWAAVTLPQA